MLRVGVALAPVELRAPVTVAAAHGRRSSAFIALPAGALVALALVFIGLMAR